MNNHCTVFYHAYLSGRGSSNHSEESILLQGGLGLS